MSLLRKLGFVVFALVLVLAFWPVIHSYAQAKVVRITLIDENGSGEDGSAQITDQGDGTTKVELIMTNQPTGAEQPASLHTGTCTNLDADVAFALTPVKDLKSTGVIKTALTPLLNSKYAVVVTKSAADNTVISCGILPSAVVANGGTMTMAQVMSTLLDQANELQGAIKNKEADGSENAYNAFHATFAAHENDIKAESPPDQEEVDTAMNSVNTALSSGNWDAATAAAAVLVTKVTEAQEALASISASGSGTSTDLSDNPTTLESQANDLVRETTNKDADGAKAAYNSFHTTFAANEAAIQAKNASAQSNIETVMNELNDAINAGDWSKASTAANELVNTVKASADMVSGTSGGSSLPVSGAGDIFLQASVCLALLALGLLSVGVIARRKATGKV